MTQEWVPVVWSGEKLRKIRMRRGYPQAFVLEQFNAIAPKPVSHPTYSNWEFRGVEPKSYCNLKALAQVLKCRVADFFVPAE